jgi:hypothetical protein
MVYNLHSSHTSKHPITHCDYGLAFLETEAEACVVIRKRLSKNMPINSGTKPMPSYVEARERRVYPNDTTQKHYFKYISTP